MMRLLTTKEASAVTGLSKSWLEKEALKALHGQDNASPPFIKLGVARRYPSDELEAWQAQFPRYGRTA
jgi:predicted DNA-binding transcriptional regulator AlpA